MTACDKPDAAPSDTNANAVVAGPGPGVETAPVEPPASEATCMTAAENLIKLMQPTVDAQLAQIPEAQRAELEEKMKAELDPATIAAQCEQQKPDIKQLECVTNAKTAEEVQACQGPPPGAHGAHGAPGQAAPQPGPGPAPDGAKPDGGV